MKALVAILTLSSCITNNYYDIGNHDGGVTQDGRLIGTWKAILGSSGDEALTFRADGTLLIEVHLFHAAGPSCITHQLIDGLWANQSTTTLTVATTTTKAEVTDCADASNDMPLQDTMDAPMIYSESYLINGTTLVMHDPTVSLVNVYTRQ
jgi:hypothetical protein